MRALDRKLVRDLSRLRGQIVTICLVVAAGIAGFIAMQTAYRSLQISRDDYYQAYRFPDVFAQVRRAPRAVAERIRALPGVSEVQTRVTGPVRISQPDGGDATSGRVLSLPNRGAPHLAGVHLVAGRLPEPGRRDEALLLEGYAEAHGVKVGDRIPVVIDGVFRRVKVTGLAMSPEFVFAFGGNVLDYEPGRFAVLWLREAEIAPALGLVGGWNDLVLELQPDAVEADVIDALRHILEPYGALAVHGRELQMSDHFLGNELAGLRSQAVIIPLIFLGVAAYLLNVVLGRLVELQRLQIATLKAVGYSDGAIAWHLFKLVGIIVLVGAALGGTAGGWAGHGMLALYRPYFRFPVFLYRFDPWVMGVAALASVAAAAAGAGLSARRVMRMQPAEAMRPPAPPTYKLSLRRPVWHLLLGPLGRMVLRETLRRPLRMLVSILGIAMAIGILVLGYFARDSMEIMLDVQFHEAMREDVTVAFREPLEPRALGPLRALPGVRRVEGLHVVPVRLHAGPRSRESSLEIRDDGGDLRRLVDRRGQRVTLPPQGVLLSDVLADRLGVAVGDRVDVEILEGARRTRPVQVAGLVDDMLGLQAYMGRAAAQRWRAVTPAVSQAMLAVDGPRRADVRRRLLDMPAVASVASPAAAQASFEKSQGDVMLGMQVVLTIVASILAVGIVYNNARITLSMRSHQMALMRVLGFTRGEVSVVLLAQLAAQVVLAIPLGMWLGTLASEAVVSMDPENFRLPVDISASTYAYAALVTLVASMASAYLVHRKLTRLDLLAVLKARE